MSRIVCDKSRCVGCLACVVACMDARFEGHESEALSPRIHERESLSSGLMQFFTRSCLHCASAPCAKVCPAGAISRGENGIVRVARDKCVGCRACAEACPFDVPRYDGQGKMTKCELCHGEAPACVNACPRQALKLL